MLKFHVMDAVAIGEHLRSVQDVERPGRVVRMRGGLQNAVETERHDGEAVQLCSIGSLGAGSPA